KEPVYSVAFCPSNPNLIASGGGNDHAYIWNCQDGEKVHDLKAHADSITCVAFNVNGQYVATGGMDGFVRVSRTDTGECVQELEPSGEIIWLHWHPKGNVLLAGTNEGTMWMWTIPTGTVMQVISGHSESITDGRFTHDGKRIVSVSEDSSFGVWDPRTGGSLCRVSGQEDARFHPESITCIALSQDDTLALTGSTDGTARLVRTETGSILQSFEAHTESVESVGFCEVLPLAALGSVDGGISIWDINTMKLRKTVKHEDAVIQIRWLPQSPLLLSCSADRTVRLWDARTGECVRKWMGHQDSILTMDAYTEAIGEEGHAQLHVVTGSDDGCALVFRR
ncbi:quinon protein alcohol dehydrogenase-like superfamily, partial [Piptocephalis cylindrospora]